MWTFTRKRWGWFGSGMALFLPNNVPRARSFAFKPLYKPFTGIRTHSTVRTLSLSSNHNIPARILSHHLHANPLASKKQNGIYIRDNHHSRKIIHSRLFYSSVKQQQQQENFVSHKSSDFVTHFVALGNEKLSDGNNTIDGREFNTTITTTTNLTIEEAIQSVLPVEFLRNRQSTSSTSLIEIRQSLVERENESVVRSVEARIRHDPSQFPPNTQLSPSELIALGSVWFLSGSAPRGDPGVGGGKPVRLELKDLTRKLEVNDYLRIHHSPRRFPTINAYDWGRNCVTTKKTTEEDNTRGRDTNDSVKSGEEYEDMPGAIIAENTEKGYIIVNKPPGVPVHATVDNLLENVSAAVGRSLLQRNLDSLKETIEKKADFSGVKRKRSHQRKMTPLIYVVPVQRLDQNTSGIFVMGTKKKFAAYFAKLLRDKTGAQLKENNGGNTTIVTSRSNRIYKKYRCLVCTTDDDSEISHDLRDELAPKIRTMNKIRRLRKLSNDGAVIRHYLKSSDRAPKIFSDYPEDSTWSECLLKVTSVGDVLPVVGSTTALRLSQALWSDNTKKPEICVGVVEIELELLTGRTHQIRGQLSQMGFPLCGDAMYGGVDVSIPSVVPSISQQQGHKFIESDRLALQCCELKFPDPEYVEDEARDKIVAIQSERLNTFKIDEAWWSVHLDCYRNDKDDKLKEQCCEQ